VAPQEPEARPRCPDPELGRAEPVARGVEHPQRPLQFRLAPAEGAEAAAVEVVVVAPPVQPAVVAPRFARRRLEQSSG
jgi:hypothetical protein